MKRWHINLIGNLPFLIFFVPEIDQRKLMCGQIWSICGETLLSFKTKILRILNSGSYSLVHLHLSTLSILLLLYSFRIFSCLTKMRIDNSIFNENVGNQHYQISKLSSLINWYLVLSFLINWYLVLSIS